MIGFQCNSCGEFHEGVPAFGWDYPIQYLDVPELERLTRCILTSDTCIIDDELFFIRGCLEIRVHGNDDPFVWGVWVSLSERNFERFVELYEIENRARADPFMGWLCAYIRIYPDTLNLKAMVHLRNGGLRPLVELEPTEHLLAVEQRDGISMERVAEIYQAMVHEEPAR